MTEHTEKSALNVAKKYVSQKISVGCLWLVLYVVNHFIQTLNSAVPDKRLLNEVYSQP